MGSGGGIDGMHFQGGEYKPRNMIIMVVGMVENRSYTIEVFMNFLGYITSTTACT